jgi:hypothetical protein
MSNPVYGGVSNDELDSLIWHFLRDRDGHATNDAALVVAAGGRWRRIDSRMQAMRKAGRIRFHRRTESRLPARIKAHGWEVLGCPGAGIQEDGQFSWAYGCADCLRRIRPDPADGVVEPPGVVFEECELRIEP